MRRAGMIAAAALAVVSSSPAIPRSEAAITPQAAPAAGTPIDDAESEILQLSREGHDRLTVPVRIGDAGPFDFLIDTGAQATVVSSELADRLGVEDRSPATLVGMTSTKQIEVAVLPHFALGSRMFAVMTAPLVAKANIGSADGVLGVDSLQDQRVLLDFQKRTIEIAEARELGGNRGFEIVVRARRKSGQLIITEASLNGIPVAIILGTGSESSVGNRALERRLRAAQIGEANMTDINGVTETGGTKLARDLRIGRARVSAVPITFVDSPSFAALDLENEPALVLGMGELRLFRRVAIDFKQRRVLFDMPANAGTFTEPAGF